MTNKFTYLRWSDDDCSGLAGIGITELLTEVHSSGAVTREIGLDLQGRVVHIAPSPRNTYGLFDNQTVELLPGLANDLSAADFESLWASAPSDLLHPRPSRLSTLLRRLRRTR
jgi:hypothetical protein